VVNGFRVWLEARDPGFLAAESRVGGVLAALGGLGLAAGGIWSAASQLGQDAPRPAPGPVAAKVAKAQQAGPSVRGHSLNVEEAAQRGVSQLLAAGADRSQIVWSLGHGPSQREAIRNAHINAYRDYGKVHQIVTSHASQRGGSWTAVVVGSRVPLKAAAQAAAEMAD
jgi:hypothetical protein